MNLPRAGFHLKLRCLKWSACSWAKFLVSLCNRWSSDQQSPCGSQGRLGWAGRGTQGAQHHPRCSVASQTYTQGLFFSPSVHACRAMPPSWWKHSWLPQESLFSSEYTLKPFCMGSADNFQRLISNPAMKNLRITVVTNLSYLLFGDNQPLTPHVQSWVWVLFGSCF